MNQEKCLATANVFNNVFVDMVPNMNLINNHNFLNNTATSNDPLEKIIDKYKNQPSITFINSTHDKSELTFTFQPFTKNQTSKLIKLLNDKKQYSRLIFQLN